MEDKILELEKKILELQKEILSLKRNTAKYANVTDTEIILTDTLNDEDRYKVCIMSSNLIVEKVGD